MTKRRKTENPNPKSETDYVRIPEELKPDPELGYTGKNAVIYSDKESSNDPDKTLWDLYASGYKLAGDSLIEEHAGASSFNVLIYPIVFLYRHYIELRLKQISIYGNEYFEEPIITDKEKKEILFKEHKLDKLWELSRKVIEKLFPEEREEKLSSMKKLIDIFIEMDKRSFSFRYPIDTSGNPNHLDKRNFISVIRLKKIVNELGSYLDGTAGCIYDMPGHGVFLPGQRKMDEEQRKILVGIINSWGRPFTSEEISKLIKEKFGLHYSPEQLLSHPEIFELPDDESIEHD
jgi:hypothetical protein